MKLSMLGLAASMMITAFACGAEPGEDSREVQGVTTVAAGDDPTRINDDDGIMHDPEVIRPPRHSACTDPQVLTLRGFSRESFGDGEANAFCEPTNAPQVFYLVEVPPQSRAVIHAQPLGDWIPIVRVMRECAARKCDVVGSSRAPGIYTQVTLTNTDSAVMRRIVTVSTEHARITGLYDLSMELIPGTD